MRETKDIARAYKLTVAFSGKTVERREVDADRVTIGRSPDCDIVIDNLGISRTHAEILRENNVYSVRDLHSNNGTFVNGKRITRHNLNDGDEIAIGKFSITYHAGEATAEAEAEEADEPAAHGGDFTLAIDSKQMADRFRERASRLKAYLLVGAGPTRRPLTLEKPVFSIGRKGCDLQVPGFFTAKKHALIIREETGFRVVDTSQKRRTYLNGNRVDEERLKDGDVIVVAGVKIQFMVGTPVV